MFAMMHPVRFAELRVRRVYHPEGASGQAKYRGKVGAMNADGGNLLGAMQRRQQDCTQNGPKD